MGSTNPSLVSNPKKKQLIWVTLAIAGASQRQDDLFSNEGLFSRGKSALKGLKGVENVYTQHTPHLYRTIESLDRARLKEVSYPRATTAAAAGPDSQSSYNNSAVYNNNESVVPRPREVILFIVGGSTYEEARTVALLNTALAQGAPGLGTQPLHPGSTTTTNPPSSATTSTPSRIILGGTDVLNSSMFLDMLADAAYGAEPAFPTHVLRPTGTNLGPAPNQGSLAAAGHSAFNAAEDPRALIAPERLADAADGAKNLVGGLFANLRERVEGFGSI